MRLHTAIIGTERTQDSVYSPSADAFFNMFNDSLVVFMAGPPGFEPGTAGSEDPRLINHVSSRNHKLETLSTNDYLY